MVERILKRNGIEKRPRVKKEKPEREKDSPYHYIANRIRFDVTSKWLSQYRDVEKLKFLNKCIMARGKARFDVSTQWYKKYIAKFYYDETFNRLYDRYISSGRYKYFMPSLDHILPRSLGGTNDLNNLRFCTLLENMCKRNIPPDEWEVIKKNLLIYFT